MTRAEDTLTLCEFEPGNTFAREVSTRLQPRFFAGRHDPALDGLHRERPRHRG